MLTAAAAAGARQGRPAEDVVVDADPALFGRSPTATGCAQAVDNLVGNALRHGSAPVRA